MNKPKRDDTGRFLPGTAGGPGRPPRAVEHDYLAALANAYPPDLWRQACDRAVTDALAGDPKARDWLRKYLVGAPAADAPSEMTVTVNALVGADPLADALARRTEARRLFCGADSAL